MERFNAFQKAAAWLVLSSFCWAVFADVGFLLWFSYPSADEPFRWFIGGAAALCFGIVGAAIFFGGRRL
jgi:hypothetical protein